MRVVGQTHGTLLGYVRVQIAAKTYVLPVESRPLVLDDGSKLEPGFFEEGEGLNRFGIRVDSTASAAVVKETIERASEEAARRLSRKLLN